MVSSINNSSSNSQSSSNSNYTVKSGDTLSAIAERHNLSVNDLMKANPQISNPNMIRSGQDIYLPGMGGSRKTGSLSGMTVATAKAPSESPEQFAPQRKAQSASTQSASLPGPYNKYQDAIMAASKKYDVPPEIITAVMSRESNGQNIVGDGGHGRGLMQIDDRSHGSWLASHNQGLDPASNIDYGTSIIRQNLNAFGGDYKKALAAYNAGGGNVQAAVSRGLSADAYTTGHDYGSDVLSRAQGFKKYFDGSNTSSDNMRTSTPSSSAPRGSRTSQTDNSSMDGIAAPRTGGSPARGGSYMVKSGDNLSTIAARNGMSLQALEAANPQIKNFDLIFPGQMINMPGGSQSKGRVMPQGMGNSRTAGSSSMGMDNISSQNDSGNGSDAIATARSVLGQNIASLKNNGPLAKQLDKWPANNVCCANFVSACLEKAGQINHSEHNDSVKGLASNLSNDPRWAKTSLANAKPGDVVCFNVPGEGPMSHVVMFAGMKNGQPSFIGSNNVNSDGSQRITEGHMGYPIGAVYHFKG